MDPKLTLDLHLMLPELLLAGAALGLLLADLLVAPVVRAKAAPVLAALGLLVPTAILVVWLVGGAPRGTALALVGGEGPLAGKLLTGWRTDDFSVFARALAAAGGLLAVLLSIPYTRRMDRGHGEFYVLLLFAILGVMLVSGVSDLLSLFLCVELVTVSSYVLAAFKRADLRATEAGLKYLVVGAVSSAVLLLGVALVYGAVGDVSFDAIASHLRAAPASVLLVAGLVLLVVGILFKVGAVPFHVWIPDVYQGAPSPVTAFLSTGSKAAGVILLLRLGQAVFIPWAEAGHGLTWVWVLGGLSVATLLVGLLGAIPQRSLKRFLGYSSIGHAGYLLMGVAALAAGPGSDDAARPGATAVLYYLLAFVFTNLTAFTVIVLVSGATGGRHEAESYRGLSRRAPFLALAMLLAFLSLAGVPPLSGFFGKFLVLRAVLDGAAAAHLTGLYALAFAGAAGVAVSLYLYLKWIREMYFEAPPPLVADVPIRVGGWAMTVLVVGLVAMLAMGVVQGPFYDLARSAAESLASL